MFNKNMHVYEILTFKTDFLWFYEYVISSAWFLNECLWSAKTAREPRHLSVSLNVVVFFVHNVLELGVSFTDTDEFKQCSINMVFRFS